MALDNLAGHETGLCLHGCGACRMQFMPVRMEMQDWKSAGKMHATQFRQQVLLDAWALGLAGCPCPKLHVGAGAKVGKRVAQAAEVRRGVPVWQACMKSLDDDGLFQERYMREALQKFCEDHICDNRPIRIQLSRPNTNPRVLERINPCRPNHLPGGYMQRWFCWQVLA